MRSNTGKIRDISLSLFCNEEYRHELIRDGVRPFLQLEDVQSRVRGYHLCFSSYRGNNVRLHLFAPGRYCKKVSREADKFFKAYFGQTAFTAEETPIRKWHSFMPFPPNTIQYGLYYENTDRFELSWQKFREHLSVLIMELLCQEPIDEKGRITFALYLHLVLVDTFTELSPEHRREAEAFYKMKAMPAFPAGPSLGAFEMDPQQLWDIRQKVSAEMSDPDGWYSQWKNACELALTELSKKGMANADGKLASLFKVSGEINEQLDIRDDSFEALWLILIRIYKEAQPQTV